MNARITSVAAITAAHKATTSLAGLWADAYAATAKDVAGGASLRDISDALRKAGVKASKDIVGDFALAATLTASPFFAAAHADKVGADRIMLPHSLVTRARTARGVAYVRTVLASLDGLEGDDLEKATRKAVRELHAAKREAKPDTTGEATTGEETSEATTGEETAAPADATPTTLAEILAAASALLAGAERRLTAGETVTADERDAFMSRASRVAGLLRADSAVAV